MKLKAYARYVGQMENDAGSRTANPEKKGGHYIAWRKGLAYSGPYSSIYISVT